MKTAHAKDTMMGKKEIQLFKIHWILWNAAEEKCGN
jgi:hypothetical protein